MEPSVKKLGAPALNKVSKGQVQVSMVNPRTTKDTVIWRRVGVGGGQWEADVIYVMTGPME